MQYKWRNGGWSTTTTHTDDVNGFDIAANAVGLYTVDRDGYVPIMLRSSRHPFPSFHHTLQETFCWSASRGDLSVVRYLVTRHGVDIHTEDDMAVRSAHSHSMVTGADGTVRFLQRVAFTDYMRKRNPLITRIMEPSYAHYASLLRAFHKVMRQRSAMDAQHMVIEALVGTSVTAFFKKLS